MISWLARLSAAILVAWFFLSLSPFLALYDLARAVHAGDVETVRQRVNLRGVRVSLTKQVIAASGTALWGDEDRPDKLSAQIAASAIIPAVDPLLARLLTPEAVIDLLDDGWPQRAVPGSGLPAGEGSPGNGLGADSLAQLWRIYLTSESRGLRGLIVQFPPDKPDGERFRIRLRLSGTTWRVVEVQLPADLLKRIVDETRTRLILRR